MHYRRKAEGRRQKAGGRKYIFALCQTGLEQVNLFMGITEKLGLKPRHSTTAFVVTKK